MDSPVILFDGVCNLCNASVDFILTHDPKGRFRFAALQSERGESLLRAHGLETDLKTIILLDEGRIYTRSDAALRIAAGLSGPWSLLRLLLILPRPLRDLGYRLIARYRYSWFGKRKDCRLPSPAERDRFLT